MFSLLSVLGLAACTLNESGNLASTYQADPSRLALRGSPVVELTAACGDAALTPRGEEVLARQPYLQQVTSTSALVGWVTSSPDGARVEVTRPDGAAVTTSAAEVEAGAAYKRGTSQMWSTLEGLEPATVYCYAVADATGALSSRIGFRTAPAADSTAPIRILALGDSGSEGSDQLALAEQMATVPYELMLNTGDVAYSSGTFQQIEDYVFGVYKDLMRHVPMVPVAGNHDYETDNGAPFRKVFALPGDSDERWYSYDWGRVHFATLDTEQDYAVQAEWLERDLAASKAPWKLVYLHRPLYSSGSHGSDLKLRAAIEPILERHGVQLLLAGHDHHYERTTPQKGVVHVVTGGGGRGTRETGVSSFSARSEAVIHFVYLDVGTDELVLHAIDGTGAEFDSVVIPRVHGATL